jgi:hypothetical protein
MFCISQPQIRRRNGSQGQICRISQISQISGLKINRISTVRFDYSSLRNFFFSLKAIIAPKYGDTSATYWKLYGSKTEINDENLIDSLNGSCGTIAFLVSGDAHRRLQVYIAVSYDCLAGHFVLFHRRIIYHRNIQDAPT